MEVDLQSLFGLHFMWCVQLHSLAETLQYPPPPAFGLDNKKKVDIRRRYWSAKIDDISLSPLGPYPSDFSWSEMTLLKTTIFFGKAKQSESSIIADQSETLLLGDWSPHHHRRAGSECSFREEWVLFTRTFCKVVRSESNVIKHAI